MAFSITDLNVHKDNVVAIIFDKKEQLQQSKHYTFVTVKMESFYNNRDVAK